MERGGLVLPASYANFYIGNEIVLSAIYGEPNDDVSLGILREHFPSRRVIGLDCNELIWGLGAFHCLTQQEPKV
jgi:agmatine deiminase